ncbi:response regulator [Nannocystis pusilla]|uniref:Response regulator n=1 Tax=Nannocystis pusilla TaxID=889268 RepID=A0A9X3J0Y5_9BACT|nr:response regulator [Nannocystis pusilla]MCY1009523.1 response regulator [Nannocystis pusilla]
MAAPPRPPRDDDPRSEPWASIDEVAAHLGVRKDSIYRWIERRGLPAQKIGKLWKLKLSEVDKWMLAEGQRRSETPGQNPATATPRDYVLVVDDDEMVRESLRDFLVDEGYGVLAAADGVEAFELLAAPATPLPAVIVLDLKMPRMGGKEFREAKARDPRLAPIPVLLVTAERRVEAGGAIVLRKPIDLGALREALRKLLERR